MNAVIDDGFERGGNREVSEDFNISFLFFFFSKLEVVGTLKPGERE